MKKVKESLLLKFFVLLLFVTSGVAVTMGVTSLIVLVDEGVYSKHTNSFEGSFLEYEITEGYAQIIKKNIDFAILDSSSSSPDTSSLSPYAMSRKELEQLDSFLTNFRYVIYRPDGTMLYSNCNGNMGNVPFPYQYTHYFNTIGQNERNSYTSEFLPYEIQYGMEWTGKQDSYYVPYIAYNLICENRYEIIGITAACFLFWILTLCYLLCAAGHKKGKEEVSENRQDKLPFDLYLVLAAGAVGAVLFVANEISNYWYTAELILYMLPVVASILLVLLIAGLMSFATRCKCRTLFRNTICAAIIRLLICCFRKLWHAFRMVVRTLPYIWVQILILGTVVFFNVVLGYITCAYMNEVALLFWVLLHIGTIALALYDVLQRNTLMKGVKRLVEGNSEESIDTQHMYLYYKEFAEDLNQLGLGIRRAVAEQVKSERMKTELITNVSHDLKTPLTSMISYVDLLKKEVEEDSTAAEYVTVLERQSARLKKLIEDLMEATKVSTGNLTVSIASVDVTELLNQSVTEYEDRLTACGLKTVINTPDSKIMIAADGRLLWRIFDNLLSNICKYSLPNTRVYFDVAITQNKVQITAKNISREVLNVSAEELKERFVRGDSARHTEGSGLGLSIAQSLTELQGGSFHLYVDGDLFKAVLVFPMLPYVVAEESQGLITLAEPEFMPELQPEFRSEAKPGFISEAEPEFRSEPEPGFMSEPETEPETESETESESESESPQVPYHTEADARKEEGVIL